ncbi:MAG: glutamate racemase [Actinobacteria bacterium]|nr:glutamate racemase [Actinomycetota bacterium]MCL6105493.1 glutamate racemase [Actinomycetota bacterium]
MDERPIGMFDSGFGGLTVARAVIDLMPQENLLYIGDTARYPYGTRPLEEVREFAYELADKLVNCYDVKMIIVACNTASAAAPDLVTHFADIPVVGVISPGIKAALRTTRNFKVGVIGTTGTISAGAYQKIANHENLAKAAGNLVDSLRSPVELVCAACPGFVEFVERGETIGDQILVLAERLLAPVKAAGIDTLLLGCTHYPFLARVISEVMGPDVILVSSADETAFSVKELLQKYNLENRISSKPPTRRFISSGDVEWFSQLGRRLFGDDLGKVERLVDC